MSNTLISVLTTIGRGIKRAACWVAMVFAVGCSSNDGFEIYSEGGAWGFIDKNGKEVIAAVYDSVFPFSEGMAVVIVDGKYGFVDESGRKTIPQYDFAGGYSNGLAVIGISDRESMKYGCIDKTGKIVMEPLLDTICNSHNFEFDHYETDDVLSNSLRMYYKPLKYGLSKPSGEHITDAIFDILVVYGKGKAMFEQNGKWGLVNNNGLVIVEPQYDTIFRYDKKTDLARVKKDKKYGYINGDGDVVIELKYDYAKDFSQESLADVFYEGAWQTINRQEEVRWRESVDWHLLNTEPVTYAENNTLAETPAEIEELVEGTGVDIRNSIFLMLTSEYDLSKYCDMEHFSHEIEEDFIQFEILFKLRNDPAIQNVYVRDYNKCIMEAGLEGIHKRDFPVERLEGWGITWKTCFIDQLLTSEKLQNILYDWVKPELEHFAQRCNDVQKMYLADAFNHMIVYTSQYDHQAEKDFYQACCASDYGENLFVTTHKIVDMRPAGFEDANPFRHLEAWVYRRVEEGTMNSDQIHDWLIRIKEDLNLEGMQ